MIFVADERPGREWLQLDVPPKLENTFEVLITPWAIERLPSIVADQSLSVETRAKAADWLRRHGVTVSLERRTVCRPHRAA